MITLSICDHLFVGVRAYCFQKCAVIVKPNKHKVKQISSVRLRSGNWKQSDSWKAFGFSLAGLTIAIFALCCIVGHLWERWRLSTVTGASNIQASGRGEKNLRDQLHFAIKLTCIEGHFHRYVSEIHLFTNIVVTDTFTEMLFSLCFTPGVNVSSTDFKPDVLIHTWDIPSWTSRSSAFFHRTRELRFTENLVKTASVQFHKHTQTRSDIRESFIHPSVTTATLAFLQWHSHCFSM